MKREEVYAKLDALYDHIDETKARAATARTENREKLEDDVAEAKGRVAAAKEKQFKIAREQYAYRQDLLPVHRRGRSSALRQGSGLAAALRRFRRGSLRVGLDRPTPCPPPHPVRAGASLAARLNLPPGMD